MQKWMSTGEAAACLGVSSDTIRLWITRGTLPAEKVGKRVHISRRAVLDICGGRCIAFVSPQDIPALPDWALAVSSWWELAQQLALRRPLVLALDLALGRSWAVDAAKSVEHLPDRPVILAVTYEDEPGLPGSELWDVSLRRPFSLREEIERAESALEQQEQRA